MKTSKKSILREKAQKKIGKRSKICHEKIEKEIYTVLKKIEKGTWKNPVAGQDVAQGLVAVLGAITADQEGRGQGERSGPDLEPVGLRSHAPRNRAHKNQKVPKNLQFAVFLTTMYHHRTATAVVIILIIAPPKCNIKGNNLRKPRVIKIIK